MYFGEAFCGVLPGHEALYPEILEYAYRELRDDSGLGIAICDDSAWEIRAATAAGFVKTGQAETVMRAVLNEAPPASLPAGFSLAQPDPIQDSEALQWLFWQGFDHGSDYEAFQRQAKTGPRLDKHYNPHLGLAAVDCEGNYVAYCCIWYCETTDYAYVEPVCTVPAHRRKGIAGSLLLEAMNRAKALGAKEAYVISDLPFYEKLGFKKVQRDSLLGKA